jgi:hypothetical protein
MSGAVLFIDGDVVDAAWRTRVGLRTLGITQWTWASCSPIPEVYLI